MDKFDNIEKSLEHVKKVEPDFTFLNSLHSRLEAEQDKLIRPKIKKIHLWWIAASFAILVFANVYTVSGINSSSNGEQEAYNFIPVKSLYNE